MTPDPRPDRLARPRGVLREAKVLAVATVREWLADRGPERGAALAFYVILSLGPMMALLVAVLELLASEDTVRPLLVAAIAGIAGPQAAETAATVLSEVEPPNLMSPSSVLTVGTLAFAATAAFVNIRSSLEPIWGIESPREGMRAQVFGFLHTRLRGFTMIGLTGVMVLLSFLVTSLASSLYAVVQSAIPMSLTAIRLIDAGLSITVLGLLFTVVFRTLPGVRVEWSSIMVGAFTTAALFVAGKTLVAPFFSTPAWTSYYGPGTSVVAFLAWVYFSAQIFFLGAEFTQVWSRRRGGVLHVDSEQAVTPPSTSTP